jgi:hypothetical protein
LHGFNGSRVVDTGSLAYPMGMSDVDMVDKPAKKGNDILGSLNLEVYSQ